MPVGKMLLMHNAIQRFVRRHLVLMLLFCCSAVPLTSQAACWRDASNAYGIPVAVLRAVAKTESGFKANAVNTNTNGTRDIGVMQINSSWLPQLERYGITEKSLEDVCTNIKVGAWILSNNAKKLGWNWNAIGAYNVGCAKLSADECQRRRNRYAWKIHAALQNSATEDWPSGQVASYEGASSVSSALLQSGVMTTEAKAIKVVRLSGQEARAASDPLPDANEQNGSVGGFLNYEGVSNDE